MSERGTIVGVLLGVIFILLFIGFYSFTNNSKDDNSVESNELFTMANNQYQQEFDLEEDLKAKYKNYWTGLPISKGNPLYVDPLQDITRYTAATLSFTKSLIFLSLTQFQDDKIFEPIMNKYVDIIGWNGIFDVVDSAQKVMKIDSVSRLHWLGEALYKAAVNYPPHFGIEIASRDTLHKAPLHGFVWEHIQAVGISDLKKFTKLIDEELCYYRDAENLANSFLSCMYYVFFYFL